MMEHPIIFSGPMVRALLAGTKTQTRRVVRPQPDESYVTDYALDGSVKERRSYGWTWYPTPHSTALPIERAVVRCPYGAPGDRLWVRETWRELGSFMNDSGERMTPSEIVEEYGLEPESCVYRADEDGTGGPWRPGIFMPRAVSRITLEITDVRVQRLQDCSLDDARAEGVPQMHGEAVTLGLCAPPTLVAGPANGPDCRDVWDNRTSRENYAALWDTINSKRAPWAGNPFVWALTFRRLA